MEVNDSILMAIQDLRKCVSYLGEKKYWWNSSFHDSISADFLLYIFPKTAKTIGHFPNFPARDFLDAQVGANHYHLFRFPVSLEEALTKSKSELVIQTEDDAIKLLKEVADGLSVDNNPGPKNIGTSDKVNTDLLQVFAAEYHAAFKNGFQVHPYLK